MTRRKPEPVERKPDVLVQTGFSVAVRETMCDLRQHRSGVCLASSKETEQALLEELKSDQPCAILCPTRVKDDARELHVLVRDGAGKEQVRRRYMHQISAFAVTYMCDVQSGPKAAADRCRVVTK